MVIEYPSLGGGRQSDEGDTNLVVPRLVLAVVHIELLFVVVGILIVVPDVSLLVAPDLLSNSKMRSSPSALCPSFSSQFSHVFAAPKKAQKMSLNEFLGDSSQFIFSLHRSSQPHRSIHAPLS